MSKKYILAFAIVSLLLPALHAAPIYENDFSSSITITDTGGNTSPWINNNVPMPAAGSYTFIEGFSTLTQDTVNDELDKSGNGNAWLLINTSTWDTGDYTVSFDGLVASGTMLWDIIGGNASGSSLGVRIWMNTGSPYIRATSSGTAFRLGQTNEAGDTAGAATAAVAAGSFTDTTLTSQSLEITLTDAHVGSANDYILIGWAGTSGTIDNIAVTAVPEPATLGLVGMAGAAFLVLRRSIHF